MKYLEKYRKEVDEFVKVLGEMAAQKYVTGFGGNVAWRLEPNLILITPTMMNKGDITAEDLVFIDKIGNTVEGKRRPTGEKPMYLKFFEERPDIVSVLHCHPPTVCGFTIRSGKNWLMRPFFPETITEVGPVPLVPYAEPLTEELARNFSNYLHKYNSFMMQNHGLVTMSRLNIRWTWMNVELLEITAQSLLVAMQGGSEPQELDFEAVKNLGNVMKTRNLPLFGAEGVNKSLEGMYFEE
jgi:L-fuculose-phosphate aldolase